MKKGFFLSILLSFSYSDWQVEKQVNENLTAWTDLPLMGTQLSQDSVEMTAEWIDVLTLAK